MKFKIKNLTVFYNSPEKSTHIYGNTENNENNENNESSDKTKVKKVDNISAKVGNLNKILDRLDFTENSNENNTKIVCSFFNEAIKWLKIDQAEFKVINNNWKKEIWLVIENSKDDINSILSLIDSNIKENKKDEYFFDKNNNDKKDVWELSVDEEGNITWVDIKENEKRSYADVNTKFDGKYYKDWNKFVYEVWKVWDKWAAILRQVVALWNELWIDTKNYEEIKKKIENLYVYKEWKNVIFSKDKHNNNDKQVKDLEITIKWKTIKWIDALNYEVRPWDKIDIGSLAIWLGSKKFEAMLYNDNTKKTPENNEKIESWWWNFYTSWGIEYWDLPDEKKITYTKANWENINTDGKSLQINAQNMFDIENKGNNKFSLTKEIWKWKDKSYLVIWETPSGDNFKIDSINSVEDISNLKSSWLEAWLASYDKNWNMIIKEVWDPNVHEFVRKENFSDAWKSVNNPIYLDSPSNGKYTFKEKIDWKEQEISFSAKNLKNLKFDKNSESVKLGKNDLNELFGENFKVDDLFKSVNWKSLFMEFEKFDWINDVILKFEKTENWLKITKIGEYKENNTIFNSGNIELSNNEKNEMLQQCDVVKSINEKDNEIQTYPIKNLWYSSFKISISKDNNLIFTKNWKDNSEDNYSFQVKWFDLKTKENLINFFNKDFIKIILAVSKPWNMEVDKKQWKNVYSIDKSNINYESTEKNKKYVRINKNSKTWDDLIKEAINQVKPENKNKE